MGDAVKKRLTPPIASGITFLSDGPKGKAQWLQMRCSLIEEALILSGATASVDYTHKDLMTWALEYHRQETEEDSRGLIAKALWGLGTGDAATRMGAVELLSLELKNGLEALADAVGRIEQ